MAQLKSNVYVVDEETGEGAWYGPDYPDAGDPPDGAVTNSAAFEEQPHEVDLRFRDDDFAGSDDDPRAVLHPDEPETKTAEKDSQTPAATAAPEPVKPAAKPAARK